MNTSNYRVGDNEFRDSYYQTVSAVVFIVNVFKDRTQSSWVKECAPTKHPITEIWVKEFLLLKKRDKLNSLN